MRLLNYGHKYRSRNAERLREIKLTRRNAEREHGVAPRDIETKWEAGNKTCLLCGQPIDKTLKAPHPMSRTLEHITPIARGGRHDLDNLAFAHWSCNASKGAKTLEEYREWQAGLQHPS